MRCGRRFPTSPSKSSAASSDVALDLAIPHSRRFGVARGCFRCLLFSWLPATGTTGTRRSSPPPPERR
eukprot:3440073-Prorocentrum_lima.AAC.1